jgi:Fic family protein
MSALDQHILDYFAKHPNKGAGDIPPFEGEKIPRQTLTRRLTGLVGKGELIRTGERAGTRYLRGDVDAYLRIPAAQRPPVPYMTERGSTALPRFSRAQLEALTQSAGPHGATAEDTARSVRERLLIELSYASSNLEGNTYDLLQTEALIRYGQVAKGKTALEAKMILNHRDAIWYLLDNIATAEIDWVTLRDLHALLSDGLLDDNGDSGRIRRRIVAIGQSSYKPLDNEFQIREAIDALLAAANDEREPFNQSLMLMTGVAYVQPFADCNKRTGRVFANLPLLRASLPPLSFLSVDKEAYTRGLLTYYELGNGNLIAKAYADAYPVSADAYRTNAHHKPKSAEQVGVELRYQGFVRERLKEIILGSTDRGAALPDSIPAEDRALVAEMIRVQMDSLHPGRAAPLGVKSNDIDAYLQKIVPKT